MTQDAEYLDALRAFARAATRLERFTRPGYEVEMLHMLLHGWQFGWEGAAVADLPELLDAWRAIGQELADMAVDVFDSADALDRLAEGLLR